MLAKIKNIIYSWLRRSEKYTKTDMVYLIKGSFWLNFSSLISILASLVSSIAFANLLPKETYGIYRYILSTVSLLVIPTLHGINTSLTRSIASGHDGSFYPALKTKIKYGSLGGIMSLLLAAYYYYQHNSTLSLVFIVTAIFIPIMDPLFLYLSLLTGKKLFKLSAKYSIIIRIVATISLIITAFFTTNIIIIMLAYYVSNTILRLIFFLLTIKKIKLNKLEDTNTIKFGTHLSVMSILGQISAYVDKVLIFHYAGAAALAGYYLAMIPFKQIQVFLGSLNTLALPKFSSSSPDELKKTLPKKIIKSYFIIIPIVALYLITANPLFAIFYPKYMDAVNASKFFILILLFYPITIFNTAITARTEQKKLYTSSISYAIIRIIMLLALVPIFGINGAIASILITTAINAIITTILFYKIKL